MSYFRPAIDAMTPYISGEQPKDTKAIKLNTNENPYPASSKAYQAIREALDHGLERYPDPMGNAFRQRASQLYGVDPDWILCGNGSDDILTILTRSFVGENQALRMAYPSYILYKTLSDIQGAICEQIPFQRDWSLPENFVALSKQTRAIYLPNPNSPSGTMIPPSQIAKLAQQISCPILIDEAYADFAEENCIELVKQYENILVSRTLSKSYGLAGLRFGFLIARPQIIAQLASVKDSYNCDSLSIAGATAAIDDQAWFTFNRQKIIGTRTKMTERLRKLGFEVADSQANFVWATHPDEQVSEKAIYEELKKNRILVRYIDYPDWGEGLRISVGTEEQISACFGLIEQMIK